MMSRVWKYVIVISGVAMALFLLPAVVEAQCSMCRAVLSASDAKFIRSFNLGVLVLLVPPVSMFCTIFIVLRRHEKVGSHESGAGGHDNDQDADF